MKKECIHHDTQRDKGKILLYRRMGANKVEGMIGKNHYFAIPV